MKRRDPGLEPELEAFLEHRAIERRVPPEIRARILARARGILPSEASGSAEPAPPLPPAMPGYGRFRIALAFAVAVACVAAGAVAALRARSVDAPRAVTSPPMRSIPAARLEGPPVEASVPDVKPVVAPTPVHAARPVAKDDPLTAELELLQRAHAAYTRREFSLALGLVAEHARRFPRGRLAEQREALRVRSLLGSGRADEAHRAAAAFAVRFPRSVLLPQVAGSTESSEP